MSGVATYADASSSPAERVRDLLGRLTVEEKIGQLNQRLMGWRVVRRAGNRYSFTDELYSEIERWGGLGAIYGLHRADAWSGMDWSTGILPEHVAEVSAQLQRVVAAGSRLAIPALVVEEAPHGRQGLGATLLPTAIGLGASWDPARTRALASAVAHELSAVGAHVALLSGLDIMRDPRWGRSEECFSEDPLVAALHVEATVRGLQGDGETIDSQHVAVVVKHLAGQGAGMGGRNASGALLGPRELHEVHLPAARAAARARVGGFMAAYNDIDGVPCSANRELLTAILRDDWDAEGIVMADMGALDRLAPAAGGLAEAAALALEAGVDMSLGDECFAHLPEALDRGLTTIEAIDRACARVLALKVRLGLLDDRTTPSRPADFGLAPVDESNVVLLSNDGLLPLDPATARIAVIGPNADDLAALLGDYVPPLRPGEGVTVAAGLRAVLDGEVRVVPGCRLRAPLDGGLAQAVEAAAWADLTVLVLGGSSRRVYDGAFADNGAATDGGLDVSGGEGLDMADVSLPPAQRDLVRAVVGTGTPAVTVVVSGRPLGIGDALDATRAVLYAWYPGPAGGRVVAEVLTGAREPTGRMPVTLAPDATVLPASYNRRSEWTYGYLDVDATPVARFGSGLGYTTWECTDVRTATPSIGLDALREGGPLATATVRNTGDRAGRQVVQLYGQLLVPGRTPRAAMLLGFVTVDLTPGESRPVTLTIPPEHPMLSYEQLPGVLRIAVGFSSDVEFATGREIRVTAGRHYDASRQ